MFERTGFKAALAAEMVSFWIWSSDVLFDRFSTGAFPSAVAGPAAAAADDDGAAEVDDDVAAEEEEEAVEEAEAEAEAVDGSAVIRSMSVVPEESCAAH